MKSSPPLPRNKQVDAISWAASKAGTSYGKYTIIQISGKDLHRNANAYFFVLFSSVIPAMLKAPKPHELTVGEWKRMIRNTVLAVLPAALFT